MTPSVGLHYNTADLCDKCGDQAKVCHAPWLSLGGRRTAWGAAACLRTFEDTALLRRALGRPGGGRLLVVDAGGSLRVALLGEKMARLGMENGWAGVIIHGAVRDADQLAQLDFAVFALGKVPARAGNAGNGLEDIPVTVGDTVFSPGDFVCVDSDGVVAIPGRTADV